MSICIRGQRTTTTTNLAASNSAVVVGRTDPSHLIILFSHKKQNKSLFALWLHSTWIWPYAG